MPASALPAHAPDLANGEYMFTAGGCAECHAAPLKKCDDLKTKDKDALAGGRCLKTPFGIFNVPNISPGQGDRHRQLETLDFVNAMKRGIAPDGEHLYPAFPYASYQRMSYEDLIDLKAYLDTLPAVKNEVPPHELAFPFNIRRGLGALAAPLCRRQDLRARSEGERRAQSRRLSCQGPGPLRRVPFAAQYSRRHRSRTRPSPARRIPKAKARSPTSRRATTASAIGAQDDIAYLLETGNTPDFDVIGGTMAPVQENMAQAHAGRPQGHRRLSQVVAAAARRRAQMEKKIRTTTRRRTARRRRG